MKDLIKQATEDVNLRLSNKKKGGLEAKDVRGKHFSTVHHGIIEKSCHSIKIPSNITLLDCIMGGGFPSDKIIQISGVPDVGKSTLVATITSQYHKANGISIMAESEGKFDYQRAVDRFSFDTDRNIILEVLTVQQLFQAIEEQVWSLRDNAAKFIKKYDPDEPFPMVVIVDTLYQFPTMEELGRDKEKMMNKPSILRSEMRRISKLVEKLKFSLIFITQTSGGKVLSDGEAVDFASQIRLSLRTSKPYDNIMKKLGEDERPVGHVAHAKCLKNQAGGISHFEVPLRLYGARGFDDIESNYEYLKMLGVGVLQSGAWVSFPTDPETKDFNDPKDPSRVKFYDKDKYDALFKPYPHVIDKMKELVIKTFDTHMKITNADPMTDILPSNFRDV